MEEPERELSAAAGSLTSGINQALDAFKSAVEKIETKMLAQKRDASPFAGHYSIQLTLTKEAGMFVAEALPNNGVRKFKALAPTPYEAGRKVFRELEKKRALER
jgi:hypothetical protein